MTTTTNKQTNAIMAKNTMLWCYIDCISDSIITYTNTSQVGPLTTKYFFTISRHSSENVYMSETAEEKRVCAEHSPSYHCSDCYPPTYAKDVFTCHHHICYLWGVFFLAWPISASQMVCQCCVIHWVLGKFNSWWQELDKQLHW